MSVNKVILLGNVGKDPDVRHLDNGVAVASLTLATSDRAYTLQNGTQVPERTEWHNIVAWKGLAEIIEKYVKKGSKIYLEGKIRTRSYEDSNKVKRYITEIYADNIEKNDLYLLNTNNQYSSQTKVQTIKTTMETQTSHFNKHVLEDAQCAAIRAHFLSTRREFLMYSSAIYSAIMWGKKIDEQNRIIREKDTSVK